MSRRSPSIPAVAAILIVSLFGCAKTAETRLPPLAADSVSPESLWKRIGGESPYTRYAFWPDHEGIQMGQAPHGGLHKIFINATIAEALPVAGKKVPNGGIIVLENLNSEAKLVSLSVMAKIEGFDPGNGDWYWASYDLGGRATESGSVRSCYVCHEGMKDNDFVIVRRLDAPLK